jgi:hypothetical protein
MSAATRTVKTISMTRIAMRAILLEDMGQYSLRAEDGWALGLFFR